MKLQVTQLVKQITAFKGTPNLMTVFTRVHHLFLSQIRLIQFTMSHPSSLLSSLQYYSPIYTPISPK